MSLQQQSILSFFSRPPSSAAAPPPSPPPPASASKRGRLHNAASHMGIPFAATPPTPVAAATAAAAPRDHHDAAVAAANSLPLIPAAAPALSSSLPSSSSSSYSALLQSIQAGNFSQVRATGTAPTGGDVILTVRVTLSAGAATLPAVFRCRNQLQSISNSISTRRRRQSGSAAACAPAHLFLITLSVATNCFQKAQLSRGRRGHRRTISEKQIIRRCRGSRRRCCTFQSPACSFSC
jgi:hypothetical protein